MAKLWSCKVIRWKLGAPEEASAIFPQTAFLRAACVIPYQGIKKKIHRTDIMNRRKEMCRLISVREEKMAERQITICGDERLIKVRVEFLQYCKSFDRTRLLEGAADYSCTS